MIESKQMSKVPRRRKAPRRERAFRTKAFSLPADIALLVEQEATRHYGGNQSALATAALCVQFGVEPKVEYSLE